MGLGARVGEERGPLVESLRGPDQELGKWLGAGTGGAGATGGVRQGAVLSAPFGKNTLEINTNEVSTRHPGHVVSPNIRD